MPVLLAQAAAVAGVACSSDGGDGTTAEPGPCAEIEIQRFDELIVVDEEVVSDPRASNASSGPWSFRGLMEELAPPGMDPTEFAVQWIDAFTKPATVNLYPVEERESVVPVLLCPWWKRTPENGCDADCTACTAHDIDLAQAPFRLMAIVNRIDLREASPSPTALGEGRFVFALTNGPGDDPASAPLPMSVIFEYALYPSEGRDARYWAERWHALSSFEDHGEEFRQALQEVTDSFSKRGADPERPDVAPLGQIRTNENAFFWLWQQREFHLTPGGLVLAPTSNTPDRSVNNTETLRSFLVQNEDAIMKGLHVLTPTLTGGASDQGVIWRAEVSEPLRHAFASQTCNGCHLSEVVRIDDGFHVSPFRSGEGRLSAFMHSPGSSSEDELGRRARSMQRALCGL